MKLPLLIILFSGSILGQEFGFYFSCADFYPVSGVGLLVSIETISDLNVEGRIGYELTNQEYRGYDLFLLLKYNVIKLFYLAGGIYYHDNDGYGTNGGGVLTKQLTMVSMGAGVNLSNHFAVEVLYNTNFKDELWSYTRLPESTSTRAKVYKLNFLFHW